MLLVELVLVVQHVALNRLALTFKLRSLDLHDPEQQAIYNALL